MLSQAPIKPGAFHDYDFINTRSGTHWMHSHVGLQEQQLLAAPLIVRETAEPLFDEQEHVVLLHDFTFRNPAEILAELTSGGGAMPGTPWAAVRVMEWGMARARWIIPPWVMVRAGTASRSGHDDGRHAQRCGLRRLSRQ